MRAVSRHLITPNPEIQLRSETLLRNPVGAEWGRWPGCPVTFLCGLTQDEWRKRRDTSAVVQNRDQKIRFLFRGHRLQNRARVGSLWSSVFQRQRQAEAAVGSSCRRFYNLG